MLKDFRESKGLSQIDVAVALNVSQQMVSKWEKGISFPRIDKVKKLAALFGCSVAEIMENWKEGGEGNGN